MGFTTNDGMVRVDRFKESGKWYDTIEIDMSEHYNDLSIFNALEESINEHTAKHWGRDNFVIGWTNQGGSFVCLEPYHKHSHPVMLIQPRN